MNKLYALLPAADPARPSGGNEWDRRVLAELQEAGVEVNTRHLDGDWPRAAPRDVATLARIVEQLPDGAAVLVDGLVGSAQPGLWAAHATRLRLILVVHLPLADETGVRDAATLRRAERGSLRSAGLVVATAAAVAAQLRTEYDVPGETLLVLPPGVVAAPLSAPDPTGRRLLCVAAITPRKGIDRLLAALSDLAGLDWHCQLVGARPAGHAAYHRELDRRLEAAGIVDRVAWRGPLAGAEIDRAYAESDLLILASRAEPYGMVITEALARGLPVIASNVGGVAEALGEVDGAPPGALVDSTDELTERLRAWLTDERLRCAWRDLAARRRDALLPWAHTARPLVEWLAG